MSYSKPHILIYTLMKASSHPRQWMYPSSPKIFSSLCVPQHFRLLNIFQNFCTGIIVYTLCYVASFIQQNYLRFVQNLSLIGIFTFLMDNIRTRTFWLNYFLLTYMLLLLYIWILLIFKVISLIYIVHVHLDLFTIFFAFYSFLSHLSSWIIFLLYNVQHINPLSPGLLLANSILFLFCKCLYFTALFFRAIFTGYKIWGWQFFSFSVPEI